jgi:REP element-mobilizing transposase RayT
MKYDLQFLHRRSFRLKEYDYSLPGAYFVTLITKNRLNIFGEILGEQMSLNLLGEIIRSTWIRLPSFFNVQLDEWVIMPNHLHAIIWILGDSKGEASAFTNEGINKLSLADASPQHQPIGTKPGSLGAIIQNFKSVSTRKVNRMISSTCKGKAFEAQVGSIQAGISSNALPQHIWQRDYYERIIRNQRELDALRAYITDNPRRWAEDKEYKA